MRKYIVKVHYKEGLDKSDLVWTVKAKNDKDLERVISNEYRDCLYLIEGYEYEELKGFMFKKHDAFPMCGSWVGAECMKYDLDEEKFGKESND